MDCEFAEFSLDYAYTGDDVVRSAILTLFAFLMPFISGCSLDDPSPKRGFRIVLDHASQSPLTRKLSDLSRTLQFPFLASPAGSGSFNCFAVNVSGPGISGDSEKFAGCTSSSNFRGHGFGILTEPHPRGVAIDIDLPSGDDRNILVYGIYPSDSIPECGGTKSGNGNAAGYIVGDRTIDIDENADVVIPVSYDGAGPDVTCSEGSGSMAFAVHSTFASGGILNTSFNIQGSGFIPGATITLSDVTGSTTCGTVQYYSEYTLGCSSWSVGSLGGYGALDVTVTLPDGLSATGYGIFDYVSGNYITINNDPAILDFGSTPAGTPVVREISVVNTGSSALTWSSGSSSDAAFSVSGGAGAGYCANSMPNSGGTCKIIVTFTPSNPGFYSSTISVTGSPAATATEYIWGVAY